MLGLRRMGLCTGQDLCVGGSHLCHIAEVKPNDPGLCLVRNIRRLDLESHRKPELLCGLDGGLCRAQYPAARAATSLGAAR